MSGVGFILGIWILLAVAWWWFRPRDEWPAITERERAARALAPHPMRRQKR